MNSPTSNFRRQGFTLVELLIMLVVIAVLSLIGFGSLQKAVTAARIARSSQNLGQLAAANLLYVSDHGTYAPADDRTNNKRWHGARKGGQAFAPEDGFLAPYLGKSRQITPCPLLTAMIDGKESFETGTGGYGYNAQYIGGRPGGKFDRTSGQRIPEHPGRVLHPAHTVMFATTAYARESGLQEYPYCEPPFWDFGSGPSGQRPSPTVHFRANGKALVAWCDGRVTAEPKNDRAVGANPHGGDADAADLGWFGPDEENGYWNPQRSDNVP
jgi:prepilin-type N-terminal cleavage/methylation domain-containing protein